MHAHHAPSPGTTSFRALGLFCGDLTLSLSLASQLERRIRNMLERKRHTEAWKWKTKSMPQVEPVYVRVACQQERTLAVLPHMAERYTKKGYPKEFPYVNKVILLFQRIDGCDVLLFGMYVQEYGDNAPPPNHRTVYLSYLDSVKYFRPNIWRTDVYHELLVSYIEYIRYRGFHKLVLWACPPVRGDDYLLHRHPPSQRNPRPERLREWYLKVMRAGMKRKAVDEVQCSRSLEMLSLCALSAYVAVSLFVCVW